MKRNITITVNGFPGGCTDEEIALFVDEAVSTWGGQYHPNDPLFKSLDVSHIRIGDKVYIPGGE
jgi:hypothetical protein